MPAYDPNGKMSRMDKVKSALWFRSIGAAILKCDWPADEFQEVNTKVEEFKETARKLEMEAFEGCTP